MITWQTADSVPRSPCACWCVGDVIGPDGSTIATNRYLGSSKYADGRFAIEQRLTRGGGTVRVTHWCQITLPDGRVWRMTDLASL